jgi:hypothetical protein
MEEAEMKEKPSLVERRVDTKLVIMAAWIAMMFLYIYCDFYSLFRPGEIAKISSGRMGFMAVSQMSLFAAALLIAVPSMMIFVSALASARLGRILNMAASALYFLVDIGNLIGETWGYYFLLGILEAGLVVLIFIVSLRWPRHSD